MFRDREEAGRRLSALLRGRALRDPIVLGIPRGGVVTGGAIARELGADLDVVLARKLRAPLQPELAIGAVGEDGRAWLEPGAVACAGVTEDYVEAERLHQLDEIARRGRLYRSVRPRATLAGRTVIVTDDGIATGATMRAALRAVRAQEPAELIVAVPVAPAERLEEVRDLCDDVACALTPDNFWAIGQFYECFDQADDERVVETLRRAHGARSGAGGDGAAPGLDRG